MLRGIEEGLHSSKPWGEATHYDSIVEHLGRAVRVQVKSTMLEDRGGYRARCGERGPYQRDPFDYLAASVFQEGLWYIIPADGGGTGSIARDPRLKRSKYGVQRGMGSAAGSGAG